MIHFLLMLLLGYLIGSISLGYFFGRVIRGIDIRKFGNHNTGATNTYNIVGPVFGIIAGSFDFFKSAFVYYLGVTGVFGAALDPNIAILAGLAVVAGHIAPFYLRFRGGIGVASLFGLSAIVLLFTQSIFSLVLIAGSITYAIVVSKRITFEAPFRKFLKLVGLVFPLGLIWFSQGNLLWLAGILLIASFLFDVIRFLSRRINLRYLNIGILAKQKENRRLSGYTLFLVSAFLITWLFPKEIAVVALTFFILGDFLAPIGSRAFLPIPLIRDKTIGGAIIIFAISFIAGIFLQSLTPLILSLGQILFAASLAAIFDQFSFVDDNIFVPIGIAVGLMIFTVI